MTRDYRHSPFRRDNLLFAPVEFLFKSKEGKLPEGSLDDKDGHARTATRSRLSMNPTSHTHRTYALAVERESVRPSARLECDRKGSTVPEFGKARICGALLADGRST
jgi:hypothetical protein